MAGCAGAPPAEVSFGQKIPAALEGAGLGLSDAWASRSTDGFTGCLVYTSDAADQ